MLKYTWNEEKNTLLKKTRNISFEQIVQAIEDNQVITKLTHTNPSKYQNQKIFIININNYIYCVPYVKEKQTIFLKTIYANRKYKKKYLKDKK
jgi:uncharacterized DUF497 family protein